MEHIHRVIRHDDHYLRLSYCDQTEEVCITSNSARIVFWPKTMRQAIKKNRSIMPEIA